MAMLLPVVAFAVLLSLVGLRRFGSSFLARVGVGVALVFGGFAVLFVTGETFADPGGVRAVGLTLLWAVPLVVLAVLNLRGSTYVVRADCVLLGVYLAVILWSAFANESWRSFEDDHGPVRAIGSLVLLIPFALLARRHPRVAGLLLLVLGAGPTLVMSLGSDRRIGASIGVFSSPALFAGVLLLLSTTSRNGPGKGNASASTQH